MNPQFGGRTFLSFMLIDVIGSTNCQVPNFQMPATGHTHMQSTHLCIDTMALLKTPPGLGMGVLPFISESEG
jgi:hypothetical protein